MRHSRFSIDLTGPDILFDGFTSDETWNGWDRPYFTFEQGQRILEAINKVQFEYSVQAPELDTLGGFYDAERDAFVFFYRSKRDSHSSEQDWDIFPAEIIEGQKLYPIGAGCWIWELEDKWDEDKSTSQHPSVHEPVSRN